MRRLNILIATTLCLLNIHLIAQSVGGTTSGGTQACVVSGSGFLGLSGHNGTSLMWQSSTDGGTTWTNTGTTAINQGYSNLTQTTCYRVIVTDGAFPPDTSTISCIDIFAATIAGTISGSAVSCTPTAAGTLTVTGNIGNVLNWQSSIDGGATWSSIANTSITLAYAGVAQATIYEAVVQNSPNCTIDTTSQATVTFAPPSVAGNLTLGSNDTVCYAYNSNTINLSGNTGIVTGWLSSTDNGVTWNVIANTNTTLNPNTLIQTTLFESIVQNGSCPGDTTPSIVINVLAPPAAVDAGTDTTIDVGQSAQLNGSGTGIPFWIPNTGLNNPAIYNPIATPAGTTNYILTVTDVNGCLNADTVVVTVFLPAFTGIVSNYFSPNGDTINETWYIEDIKLFPKNEVFVYNIYGQEVYTKKGYTNDWKGTYNGAELPDGTYYYVLRFDDVSTIVKGTVDILRKK
ncbi:MAG: gliding motility-associated C-terminal domain-containing protein [Bacteroidota bacterium]|nr:gliding motility-associated C-terminal domain-containing protein [Bacteroidota bacterium]